MRFFFLLFLCAQVVVRAHSIVFVHIGPELPNYLPIAVEQARLFNKTCPIYIVGNQAAFDRAPFQFGANVTRVACESLRRSDNHHRFVVLSRHDKGAEGFWTYTSERFFYLEELIGQYDLHDVFHLENDVMLYVDVEKFLPIFHTKYAGVMGATFDCDERAVPGFVYIASPKPIAEFTTLMSLRARAAKNDMEMFMEFKKLYYPVYVEHLPIIFPEYDTDYGLRSTQNRRTRRPDLYSLNFSEFGSIFDAAALGQYLGGISPRNGEAVAGFINETCLFNPSFFSFIWKSDAEGRLVPFLCYQNREYPINNLHIHSKNLQRFFSKR